MAGGASLSMVFNARNFTKDIDAIFDPKEDLRVIIKDIARDNKLPEDWINDSVKGFIMPNMESVTVKEYSNLTVRSIDAEGLLAMKLLSGRHFSKGKEDSITLMKHLKLKDEKQMLDIIEKYIPQKLLTAKAYFFSLEAFNEYINEKEQSSSIEDRLAIKNISEHGAELIKKLNDIKGHIVPLHEMIELYMEKGRTLEKEGFDKNPELKKEFNLLSDILKELDKCSQQENHNETPQKAHEIDLELE